MHRTHFHAQVRLPGRAFEVEGEITAAACLKLANLVRRSPEDSPERKALALRFYTTLSDGKSLQIGHVDARPTPHQEIAR